jgi:hypothetical protein
MERTRSIQIRLTEEEFARLRDDAEGLGTTMSDLVRTSVEVVERVAEDDGRVPDVILVDTLAMMRIDLELNRWGVNFNQGVHAFNTCAKVLIEGKERDWWTGNEISYVARQLQDARTAFVDADAGLNEVAKRIDELEGRALVVHRRCRKTRSDAQAANG